MLWSRFVNDWMKIQFQIHLPSFVHCWRPMPSMAEVCRKKPTGFLKMYWKKLVLKNYSQIFGWDLSTSKRHFTGTFLPREPAIYEWAYINTKTLGWRFWSFAIMAAFHLSKCKCFLRWLNVFALNKIAAYYFAYFIWSIGQFFLKYYHWSDCTT